MAFVKTHMVALICGVVALAALAIAGMGMTSDAVQQQMTERLRKTDELQGLARTARNDAMIQEAERAGKTAVDQYAKAEAEVREINARKPLMDNIFPRPNSTAAPFEFRETYRAAMFALPGELNPGDTVSEAEIQAAQDEINIIRENEALQEQEGGGTAPPVDPSRAEGGHTPAMAGTSSGASAEALQSSDPNVNARLRAIYTKAQSIRLYMTTDPAKFALHLSPLLQTTSTPPTPAEMWYAQVGYWIQADVVQAIKATNDAAAALPGAPPGIGGSAIKRLESVRVHGYRLADKIVPLYGEGMSTEVVPSFTLRTSDEQFDVVRFTVVVVADQRDLLQFVDALARTNFYTLIGLEYTAVKDDVASGYVYGADPTVRAVMHFEGSMARSIYARMMPADVRTALGVPDQPAETPTETPAEPGR